jgi:hypothetical protein
LQGSKALEQSLEQLNSKQLRDLRDQVGPNAVTERAWMLGWRARQ